MHKLIKQMDQYWVKLMENKTPDSNADPRIPGVKPNDGNKRQPTAREIMFEMDVQALADKYIEDDITIVAETRTGEIITMWGTQLLDDPDEEHK